MQTRRMEQMGGAGAAGSRALAASEGFTSAGDPVCWLEYVCDECGALIEAALPATCWRCGATVAPA